MQQRDDLDEKNQHIMDDPKSRSKLTISFFHASDMDPSTNCKEIFSLNA